MSGFDPGAGGGALVVTFNTQGDERVCPVCAPYAGRQYQADDPNLPRPPLHRECRCYLTYEDSDEPVDADDADDVLGGGDSSLQGEPGGTASEWEADTDHFPDDPKGGDAELVDEPEPGVGPWEEATDYVPDNPKGGPWS